MCRKSLRNTALRYGVYPRNRLISVNSKDCDIHNSKYAKSPNPQSSVEKTISLFKYAKTFILIKKIKGFKSFTINLLNTFHSDTTSTQDRVNKLKKII